ncbi:unnamed protein product [Arabis nemorensis]|uniref:Uncharacterized protein n=1 Tax=Arabis nemorensis TaxID=586526 RepID=A0A565B9Z2_9BRAS|nr:unnamed protein product [Arabis nemorensis]
MDLQSRSLVATSFDRALSVPLNASVRWLCSCRFLLGICGLFVCSLSDGFAEYVAILHLAVALLPHNIGAASSLCLRCFSFSSPHFRLCWLWFEDLELRVRKLGADDGFLWGLVTSGGEPTSSFSSVGGANVVYNTTFFLGFPSSVGTETLLVNKVEALGLMSRRGKLIKWRDAAASEILRG